MVMDPRALAQQLGASIKEAPEYRAVQAARTKVEEHEAARIMLQDFRRREQDYRKALVEGKAGEEETNALRKLAEIVTSNPYIRELFAAEARLAELIVDLQRRMTSAAGLAEDAGTGEEEPDGKGD